MARAIDRPSDVLPTPGGADEAEDRGVEPPHEPHHRDVVEYPVLNVGEAEVVLVEHGARVGDVEHLLAALVPGEGEDPVEVVAPHRRLGRHRRHAAQLANLAQRPRPDGLGELLLLDLRLQLPRLVAVLLAQLPVDRPQLLLQVELTLVAKDRAAHLVVDLPFEAEDLQLAAEHLLEGVVQLAQRRRLQQALPDLVSHPEVRRHHTRGPLIVAGGGHLHDLRRDAPVERHVLLEALDRLPRASPGVRGERLHRPRLRRERRPQHPLLVRDPGEPHAGDPFGEDAHRAVREPGRLLQAGHDAHPVQVARHRIDRVHRLLRHQDEEPVAAPCLLHRRQRGRPPDEQRNLDIRKNHHVLQRKDGKAVGNVEGVGAAGEEQREVWTVDCGRWVDSAPAHPSGRASRGG